MDEFKNVLKNLSEGAKQNDSTTKYTMYGAAIGNLVSTISGADLAFASANELKSEVSQIKQRKS